VLKVALMADLVTRNALRCNRLNAARSLGCIAPDTSCTTHKAGRAHSSGAAAAVSEACSDCAGVAAHACTR
jgi:hypothetical protein